MQKIILSLLLSTATVASLAQINPDRKGWSFGLAIGGGQLHLNTNDTIQNAFTATLPNLKIGYMLSPRFGMFLTLPGATYSYRNISRGFEGAVVTGQYWLKDRWWVMGGLGLTFDAQAFYTVKDPAKAKFYTGFPAATMGFGYEVYRKGRLVVDLQYRCFIGSSDLSNGGARHGVANVLMIGVNWFRE